MATIQDFNFKSGALILVHSMVIEKVLNRKMWPHFGPMVVVSCNQGSTYIMCDLDGDMPSLLLGW